MIGAVYQLTLRQLTRPQILLVYGFVLVFSLTIGFLLVPESGAEEAFVRELVSFMNPVTVGVVVPLIAGFLSIFTVNRDHELGTLSYNLVRRVARRDFIIGRYLGVLTLAAALANLAYLFLWVPSLINYGADTNLIDLGDTIVQTNQVVQSTFVTGLLLANLSIAGTVGLGSLIGAYVQRLGAILVPLFAAGIPFIALSSVLQMVIPALAVINLQEAILSGVILAPEPNLGPLLFSGFFAVALAILWPLILIRQFQRISFDARQVKT